MGVVWVGGEMWVWHGCDVGVINAKKPEEYKVPGLQPQGGLLREQEGFCNPYPYKQLGKKSAGCIRE